MSTVNENALARAWRSRLNAVDCDIHVWVDGPLSVALSRGAVHICAGHAMDFKLPYDAVGVCVAATPPRLDWDSGAIDIDETTAQALIAFGLREVADNSDEGVCAA